MLDRLIQRTVNRALDRLLSEKIDEAVERAFRNNHRAVFIKTMQMQMLGCDPQMDPREAWRTAVETLNTFLDDEGCEFGDPRFDWSRDAAVTMIHEYELHHWESAP